MQLIDEKYLHATGEKENSPFVIRKNRNLGYGKDDVINKNPAGPFPGGISFILFTLKGSF